MNTNEDFQKKHQEVFALQCKSLVPGGVEGTLDGFGFLLAFALGVRNQFELHVRVRQAIGVHGHQVPSFSDWCGETIINIREHKLYGSVHCLLS